TTPPTNPKSYLLNSSDAGYDRNIAPLLVADSKTPPPAPSPMRPTNTGRKSSSPSAASLASSPVGCAPTSGSSLSAVGTPAGVLATTLTVVGSKPPTWTLT
ncbi:unnamed protein product, partial [Amoebophrya sp. A25]